MQIQSIFWEAKYDFISFFLLLIGVSLQRLETKKIFWNLERVEWPTISVDWWEIKIKSKIVAENFTDSTLKDLEPGLHNHF